MVVVDRAAVAAGTTGAGEGNILVSDKGPGPELSLQLRSTGLWRRYAQELPPGSFELEAKGGVTVASTAEQQEALTELSRAQAGAGVEARPVSPDELLELEPHLVPGLAGGVFYPQDLQVQPMRAAAQLLAAARQRGATLQLATEVQGAITSGSRITGVVTTRGRLSAGWVVNAAGSWAQAAVGEPGRPGADPAAARGLILVTEPLPPVIRHKVYTADYVANVASSSASLQTSTVIEGTLSGPVLIGSSRERVGYDRTISVPVLRQMAREAVRLFPGAGPGARDPGLRGLPAVLSRPPAGHRPRSPARGAGARLRARGRGHRAGPGHRRAGLHAHHRGTPGGPAGPFAPARFAAGA